MTKKLNPEGMASLIAAIVAPLDCERDQRISFEAAVDHRREQVLELANSYYMINDCDFEDVGHREALARGAKVRNSQNNLAKLGRANLKVVR
jgi:hypothetical protein